MPVSARAGGGARRKGSRARGGSRPSRPANAAPRKPEGPLVVPTGPAPTKEEAHKLKISEAFHLFSIQWQQNSITWYMDDQPYYSINSSQMNGQPYPFNAPFFFIMNIAVGGNWPGYPDASTQFPQTMMVDYVRVFQ